MPGPTPMPSTRTSPARSNGDLGVKELVAEITWAECEACHAAAPDVRERPCRTAYADPKLNCKPVLCDDCDRQDDEYWTEMWREYEYSRR
jgi:hypothetical protein